MTAKGSKISGRSGSWTKLVCWLGAATGLFSAGLGAATSSALAQRTDYQSAGAAPAAWQTFAKELQSRFQRRLAADDDAARQFQSQLEKRAGKAESTPVALTMRAWILPDGKVSRVEFDGLDPDVAVSLRALLSGSDVSAPPPDMLQPLHLRLSLRAKDPPPQGQ
jgi:hypothetical protein